jgi:hypothetical protein
MSKTYDVDIQQAGLSDLQCANADKLWLDTVITNTETVTANITLPDVGPNGSTITYAVTACSVPNNLTNTGIVTRPANGQSNSTAILTATLTKGASTDTDIYDVTILAFTDSDNVDADILALTWASISNGQLENSITNNLDLYTIGASGATITWTSNSSYVDDIGNVIRPSYSNGNNVTIGLTAKVTKGVITQIVNFMDLTIVALPITNTEVVTDVLGEIDDVVILGTNPDLLNVTSNLILPKAATDINLVNGVCTWAEITSTGTVVTVDSNFSITDDNTFYIGGVTQPITTQVNKPIILQLTVTSKLASGVSFTGTKTFNIIILHA